MAKLGDFLTKWSADRWALVPLRIAVGFGFVAHGYAKLARGPDAFATILGALNVPAPSATAWLTSVLELGGGVALIAGAFTAPLALPLAIIMATAMFSVHLPYGFSSVRLKAITAAGAQFGPVGYELNVLYIAALVALASSGTSPLSFDRWRATRRARAVGSLTGPRRPSPG